MVSGGIDPLPDIYFGGSSGPAGPVAARHADVYLTWGEPPEQVAREARLDARARRRAGAHAALRAAHPHPLARHLRGGVGARPVAARRARPGDRRQGPGGAAAERVDRAAPDARRCATAYVVRLGARARGRARTCGPASAWSAAAPARRWSAATRRSPTGSRTTTGSGIDEFILSGYPHVEEAYWFAEGVMPLLRAPRPARRRRRRTPRVAASPDARRSPGRVGRWRRGRRSLGGTDAQPDGARRHLDLVRLPQPRPGGRAARRSAFTLLPLAAYLTETLQMFTGIVERGRRLGGQPGVQPGRLARHRAGGRLGGADRRPRVGLRARERAEVAPAPTQPSGLRVGPGRQGPSRRSADDDDMAEIEALLRKRGIT